MTPCKLLFLHNSIAKWDLHLQVVQIENLPKHGFIQLKIYMDLDQICQVLSAANMFWLLKKRHILTEEQIMSLVLFQRPVINVVKQNTGAMFSAACIDLNYNSLTSTECLNHQGKKNRSMCFLDIYSFETHFYKY